MAAATILDFENCTFLTVECRTTS